MKILFARFDMPLQKKFFLAPIYDTVYKVDKTIFSIWDDQLGFQVLFGQKMAEKGISFNI